MEQLLGDEYPNFLQSIQDEQTYGLRLNTLKITKDQWERINPFTLQSIPWIDKGFYYEPDERPGKHPYHAAGLYYIQEPSAMAVVEAMQPKPGEKILDLAAAPGGKATHIAGYMAGNGLLVANEIHPKRARALSQNIERLGIKNTVVTNEAPAQLVKHFPVFFDRILLDAPCSGEGMFRKDEQAIAHWSVGNVAHCANRQGQILIEANKMLKPGGQLVYSTCTFSPEENEQMISHFVREHPEFSIEEIHIQDDFQQGRSEWVDDPVENLERTIRIWPQHVAGEGHFIAVLKKSDQAEQDRKALPKIRSIKNKKRLADFYRFAEEALLTIPKGNFVFFGSELYLVPEAMVSLDRLKVVRAGLHLGTQKKNRFEPSHALALSLRQKDVKHSWSASFADEKIAAYLRGETFTVDKPDGWYLILVDGFSLGWGKVTGRTMKNHYPKGLRWFGR